MKYDKAKTYVTKMNSAKELMEKIEGVSFVLWAHGLTPTKFYPHNADCYCIYNGAYGCALTYTDEKDIFGYLFTFYNENDVVKLSEDEFVEMLSELEPK